VLVLYGKERLPRVMESGSREESDLCWYESIVDSYRSELL
jgi:hypothetical protein